MASAEITIQDVLDFARVSGAFAEVSREVAARKTAVAAARARGICVTDDELQKAADAFRIVHGLKSAADTEKWLSGSGLTVEAFEEYLVTNLLIMKLKQSLVAEADKAQIMDSEPARTALGDVLYQQWLSQQMGA